ncbi:hypothetical protein SELMODRAFT_412322 [Selaginella moellendorffii]|uniref:Uncharacterized protein n=1 Tax=Selaginella moellendorffii TaxID=88036 RepID=D8RKS5_SELML|nr:hypothetical protein SELMODRAFT_412322 [Selaginella moellendorffii]
MPIACPYFLFCMHLRRHKLVEKFAHLKSSELSPLEILVGALAAGKGFVRDLNDSGNANKGVSVAAATWGEQVFGAQASRTSLTSEDDGTSFPSGKSFWMLPLFLHGKSSPGLQKVSKELVNGARHQRIQLLQREIAFELLSMTNNELDLRIGSYDLRENVDIVQLYYHMELV